MATPRGAAYGFLVDEYGPGSIAPYDPAADYAEELATLSASDRSAVVDALEDTFGRTGDSYLRAIHAIRSRLARGGTVASDLGTPRRVAFDQAMAQLPGAAVQGTVTDASGDPMTFVRVRVLPAGGDDLFTVTDGAGRFSIRGVPDGTQVEVFLDSHGPTPLATATTPAPNLAVSVPAWAGLVGTVTDAGGRPAGGVTVTVADPATGAAISTTARGDGTYRFDGLAPGAYTLTATPSAGRPVTQALTVAAVPLAIDLQLPPSSTVVGRVVAPDGTTPVGGAQVLVRHDASGDSRAATAGADGRFTLDGVTPGPSQLAVRAAGRPITTTAVDLADGPVDVGDVTFEAGVTVTGTVTSSAGGPIGGAVVVSSTGATAETDVAGDFEMVGVPLGNVTLTAVSDSTLARSVVLDTTVATTADIELEPAALVTVLVTGAAGAPVPGVDVTLTPDGDGPPTAATTGDDGTAEFRVEPGDYTVATGLFSQLETFITGPQTVEIARTSSSLRGALPDTVRRGGETAPSSGITVWFDGGGRSEYVTTDEDGAFTVDGVAGTDAELWVYDPYLGVLHETVTFPAIGQTDDLGELVPDGDILTIDLPWMDRTNAPLVYLQPAGLDGINRSFQVIPDAYDGEPLDDAVVVGHDTSIELRDLPAGDYRVTVLRALPGGGYEDAVVEFSFDGAATVTPEFPSSIAAEGTEVDGDGDPLAGALVELTSVAGVAPARRYQALTGDDGSWSVPVAEGEYRIEVRDLTTGALLSERDQEFPGGAPRPLNERSSLRRSASAVLDATAILAAIVPAGGVTPSESELKEAYADKFWPDDAPPTDGQVQQALARPFPRQPDDQCLILDTSALIIAKSDAQKAEDARLLIQETVDQAQNEVLRMAAVAALQGIRLLNEGINVVTGVKGFADAVATKAVTAGVRTAEKAADNASDVANAWIYTAEELESIQNWRATLKNAKELYELTEKVFKGFLTAVTAAEPPLTADTLAAIGEAGQLVVQLATSLKAFAKFPAAGAAKELLGPVTALLNIYNLVYEVADQFNGAIALLDSLAEANAGLRRSYDFDLQRAHASWDNFLRVGFSLTVKSGCPPPDEPPPGPGGPYGTAWGVNFGSSDPNAITGAFGVGGERWVQADTVLTNEIHFENLGPGSNPDTRPPGVPDATAPAATVDIRLPLDPAVDLDTVALGRFGFGVGATEMIFEPAPGAQSFEEERPLVLTVPSLADPNTSEVLSLTMRVTALLDRGAREVRWLLTLVDPTTGLVHPNPLAGFLPPEPVAPQGAGGGFATVSYQADDAPTGTTVTARARIVFDDNDPLDTNTWSNRLDRTAPDTTITGGATTAVGGTVSVGSTDEGSGPGLVDVWRSVDGGPLTLWKYRVDPGTIVLDGAAGQEIGLAARSSDLVFNREDVPTEVQFVTVLVEGTQPTQPTVPPSSTVPPQPTVPTEPTAPPQTTVPAPVTTPPDTTAVAPDNRSLPRTGADTLPLLAVGLVLVGLGVVLRRARPAARPPRR